MGDLGMIVVVDVGCARYGNDYSIERLIEEFSPDVLYGFDPSPFASGSVAEILEVAGKGTYGEYETEVDGCRVIVQGRAAWTHDGEIGYREDGLNSWVTDLKDAPRVPCFDLATFIYQIAYKDMLREPPPMLPLTPLDLKMPRPQPSELPEIILKIDAEGSEYDLLRHLIGTGADRLLKLAWVEWHEPDHGRAKIEEEIVCEIVEWRW